MQPLLYFKVLAYLKKRKITWIVTGAMLFIVGLPVFATFSVFNVGAVADGSSWIYTGDASTTNTYEYGYCTFWSAKRREEVGKPIPNNWGDAHTWDDRAILAGYIVDHIPTPNAIMETDRGELGHVAFVESVNPDGSWIISEMNAVGWNQVDTKTLSAEAAKNYNFIHDKLF